MRALDLPLSLRESSAPKRAAQEFAEALMPRSRYGPLWSAGLRREIPARHLVGAAVLYVGRDPDYTGPRSLDGVAAVLARPAHEIASTVLGRMDDPYAPSRSLIANNPDLWAEIVSLARAGIPCQ